MQSYIEHAAVCVKDILWSEKFFKEALGMEETRRAENEDGSLKSIWFKNGLQLMAAGDKQSHHLGLVVDDYQYAGTHDSVRGKCRAYKALRFAKILVPFSI